MISKSDDRIQDEEIKSNIEKSVKFHKNYVDDY